MKDIIEIFFNTTKQHPYTATISLSGQLEAIIGGYIIEGEICSNEWITVYYSDYANPVTTNLADFVIQENLIAYVLIEKHYAFVLSSMLEKFRQDSKGYGLTYVPFTSFDAIEYFCSKPNDLPEEFRNIEWIDDDFMGDESIPFDFEAFEKIDSGVKYLNPKHFSLCQLMNYLYAPYRLV